MLRYSLNMPEAADDVAQAVRAVLDAGWRTGDIKNADTPFDKVVGTEMMGDLVVQCIQPSDKPEELWGRHPEDWTVNRAD